MKKVLLSLIVVFLISPFIPHPIAAQVKVGVVGPLTGPIATTGFSMRNGIILAAEEINAAGGIKGVGKIDLVVEDSRCLPSDSVTAAHKLVTRDRVVAVIGDICSPATAASMRVTQKAETPQLTPLSSAYSITEAGNPWIFRIQINSRREAATMADFAVKELGLKKLATLFESGDFGQDGANIIKQTLAKYGLRPLVEESIRRGDKDFSGQLLKVKESGAEGVFLWTIFGEAALIMKQAKSLGINFVPLGGNPQAHPDYIKLAGEAAEGTYTNAAFVSTDPDPKVQDFVRKYQARFREVPDPGAALGYDTMKVLAVAIERAASLDRHKIREALLAVRYPGITGEISFDPKGDTIRDPKIIIVKGGKHIRLQK